MPPPNPDDRISKSPKPRPDPDDRISNSPRRTREPVRRDDDDDDADTLPSLAGGRGGAGLSSLAQSARQKQLNSARSTLLWIGALTLVIQVVFIFLASDQVDKGMRQAGGNPINQPDARWAALFFTYAFHGALAVLGIIFITLGLLVRKYPVPTTITGLVLYVLAVIATLPFEFQGGPPNVVSIVIRILIVVAMLQAVIAALAYERDAKELALDEDE